ncbi:P-loop containing nucleoside triphosphate hydrolase protein [Dunaliella salina]|uniref:P-loop containing nucleoside triphosphate hydrolase protein n=1 Tax=Dunaliella salina TaxID=3046 RepID=A0ABQ7H2D4_DUNSA|nr:P-loop containing nucleoside triphosphate hydrolase protein [Dunaliella salina]|eukprot:KAF5841023.1 P-loop containing nucleoside triphosphate hydrolase protein [Dunaliella salina]
MAAQQAHIHLQHSLGVRLGVSAGQEALGVQVCAHVLGNAINAAEEREQVRYQEERQLEEQRAQVGARMKQYEDELARKRLMSDHELQRQRNAELVKLQEDAHARQEAERLRVEQQIQAERRAAEQYAANLRGQIEREKALGEAEGRAKEARENEDINRRAALLRYQEEARKAVDVINSVRETSRFSLWKPKTWSQGGGAAAKGQEEIKKDFSDIILPGTLHDNVRMMAAASANTKRHGAPFRHMLFYGPPGTGKTMAAKRLARTSGVDYAIMTGGDVTPLGGKAVTQLHQIDADFIRRRNVMLLQDTAVLGAEHAWFVSDEMSEGLRGALNALLYRTGDQSKDFMVVLATNRPGDLDDAVLDRMDEALEFGLPSVSERKRMLELYMDRYIAQAGTAEGGAQPVGLSGKLRAMLRGRKEQADKITIEGITEAKLQQAAQAMEGFSGREIAKFMAAVQAAVYGSPQPVLTPQVWDTVLSRKLFEHKEREAFRSEESSIVGYSGCKLVEGERCQAGAPFSRLYWLAAPVTSPSLRAEYWSLADLQDKLK